MSVPENLSNTGSPDSNANPEHRDLLQQATSILCWLNPFHRSQEVLNVNDWLTRVTLDAIGEGEGGLTVAS